MKSLFNLPQELLDAIVDLVLAAERAPPSAAPVDGHGRTAHAAVRSSSRHRYYKSQPIGIGRVMWDRSEPYISNAYPLLLTSHSMAAMTQAAVARTTNSPDGLVYKLDLMLVDERHVWPTWTCVPALATTVGCVEVTVRLQGADCQLVNGAVVRNDRQNGRSALVQRHLSPSALIWCFYYLLEHFLRCGPVTYPVGQHDRKIAVRCLDMVLAPVDLTSWSGAPACSSESLVPSGHRFRPASGDFTPDQIKAFPLRPDWLAEWLHREFSRLLPMGYHTAYYGAILYERIGVARFRSTGQLQPEIDMGRLLRNLNFTNPSDTFGHIKREDRLATFATWKENVLKIRRICGLDSRNTVGDDEKNVPVEADS